MSSTFNTFLRSKSNAAYAASLQRDFTRIMREHAITHLAMHLGVARASIVIVPAKDVLAEAPLDALAQATCPARHGQRVFVVGIELASCVDIQLRLSDPDTHRPAGLAALVSLAIPLLTVYTPVLLQAFRRPPRPERPERLKDDEIRAPVRRLRMHITREDFDDQDRR